MTGPNQNFLGDFQLNWIGLRGQMVLNEKFDVNSIGLND